MKSKRLLRVGVLASSRDDVEQLLLRLDLPWIDATGFLLDSPTLHEDMNFAGLSALVARVDPGFGVTHLLEHLEATGHGDRPVIVVTEEARDAPWCHVFRMGIVELTPAKKLTEALLRSAFLESPARPGVMRGSGAFRELAQVCSSLALFRRTGVLDVKAASGRARVHYRWGRVDRSDGVTLDDQGLPSFAADAPWQFTEEAPLAIDVTQDDTMPLLEGSAIEAEPPLLEAALAPLTANDVDPSKVSLLVVDDDPTVLHMLKESFGRRGFRVHAAPGGAEALQALATERFDVAVLDLDMPRVDGWSVLGAMREDPRTWDTQVLLFSAHDHYRDVLARSGPTSHLAVPKSTRLGVLERLVRELMLPRLEFERRLPAATQVEGGVLGEVERVGVGWALHALERNAVTGVVVGKTAAAKFTLWFADGRLVQASAQMPRRTAYGVDALRVLFVQRPRTLALAETTVPPGEGFARSSTTKIVSAVVDRLAVDLFQVGQLAASTAVSATVDESLYGLLQQVGAGLPRQVATVLRNERLSPSDLGARFGLPSDAIVSVLRELVRRGVIRLEAAAQPTIRAA